MEKTETSNPLNQRLNFGLRGLTVNLNPEGLGVTWVDFKL